MIAKRMKDKKVLSSFVRLGQYVLDVKSLEDPAVYERLASYIIDDRGTGERVVGARVTNCMSLDPVMAIREIEATQRRNTRSQADRSYHLVFSFPEGERPSKEVLEAIEDELVGAIGLADHQRISAIHDDTRNLHVHVAINRVHPTKFNNVTPFYDKQKLMAACVALEQKYGLQVTNHGAQANRLKDGGREMEAHSLRESLQTWIHKNAERDLVLAGQVAKTWAELHEAFAEYGLEIRPRGAGLIVRAKGMRAQLKASDVSPTLAFKPLTDKLGAYEPPSERVERIEPKTVYEGRPVEQPGSERDASASQDNGRGDEREPPSADRDQDPPKQERTKKGGGRSSAVDELFERWKLEAAAIAKRRAELLEAHRRRHRHNEAELARYHSERDSDLTHDHRLRGLRRKRARADHAEERAADWQQANASRKADRQAIMDETKPIRWPDFLQREAAAGDEVALEALRRKDRARAKVIEDIITAPNFAAARSVVYADLKPTPNKYGDLKYFTKDGGAVTDRDVGVRVDTLSLGAAVLAVALASDRFDGQVLVVDGTDAFKAAVVEAASIPGLDVTFADPGMEAARRAKIAERQQAPQAAEKEADRYVRERNEIRTKVTDVLPHRLWHASDAGDAVYRGRRQFEDGTGALLWERSGEMLVQPVSAAQTRRAYYFKAGEPFKINKHGVYSSRAVNQERPKSDTKRERSEQKRNR
jgi:hypothetical protein